MSLGLRHIYGRRRVARGLEPFPSTSPGRRYFDSLMYGVGIIQPIALVPQLTTIYIRHQTTGVSIDTWILLGIFNMLWATYGKVHHDKHIMIANTLPAILDFAIVVGALVH